MHDTEQILNLPFKLHVIDSPVKNDIVIVSSKNDPELNIQPQDIPVVFIFKNSPNIILALFTVDLQLTTFFAPKSELRSGKINWKPLTTKENEVLNLFVHGEDVYFLTTKDNPRFKIIKTSFINPDLETAITVVEGNDEWQISTEYLAET